MGENFAKTSQRITRLEHATGKALTDLARMVDEAHEVSRGLEARLVVLEDWLAIGFWQRLRWLLTGRV